MSYIDVVVDPQAVALAALVKGAVNYDVQNNRRWVMTEDAIIDVYGYPRPLGSIARTRLPSICVYRASESPTEHSTLYTDNVVLWRFDYILPDTQPDKLGVRWPLLRFVWRSIFRAVQAGGHDAVYNGDGILDDAGFTAIDVPATLVNYGYDPKGEQTYPYFRGQMRLTHREVDWQGDPTVFRSLAADYILDGLEDEEQPHVQDVVYTPTGEEIEAAADNPMDDDHEGEE